MLDERRQTSDRSHSTAEEGRLQPMAAAGWASTAPHEGFDCITRLACRALDVPIAMISVLDGPRERFQARRGISRTWTPRDVAVSAHVLASEGVLCVPDATLDPRFSSNPLVNGAPHVRSYAGRVLQSPWGHRMGTLCVMDTRARTFSETELATLQDLALLAQAQLFGGSSSHALELVDLERRRFHTFVSNLPVGLFELDASGHCVYANRRCCEQTGLDAESILGDGWLSAVDPQPGEPPLANQWQRAWRSGASLEGGVRLSGGRYRANLHVVPVREAEGSVAGWIGTLEDVTEAQLVTAELQQAQERFTQLADASDVVLWMTDVATHEVLYVSPAYERIWGRTTEWIQENPWDWINAIVPADRGRAKQAFAKVLDGTDDHFEVEFRIRRPDGSVRYVLDRGFPVWDEGGRVVRMAGVAYDISELHEAREELRRRAEIDALTGVLNAGTSRELLAHEIHRAHRECWPLSVALLDVDEFKQVNDQYGHLAGDAALVHVTQHLRARLRQSDAVGRLGGDEFLVLMPNCDADCAAEILQTVMCRLDREPLTLPAGIQIRLTLSVGVCVAQLEDEGDDTLRRADAILYHAKRAGRNQTRFVDASEQELVVRLDTDVRQLIERARAAES